MGESTALIVGASRGLGLALVEEYLKRGWHVVATVRDAVPPTALQRLGADFPSALRVERLDITRAEDIETARRRLAGRRLALLFVNAGVANGPAERADTVSTDEFTRVMLTNALGPMRVIETLQDLVPPSGTLGVMSSVLGSVAENERGGWEVYRASKAALNQLMKSFAARHKDDPRPIVLMCPGWVRTDMGGPSADLAIGESIPKVVDVITARSGIPGLIYVDYQGRTVQW